MKTNTFPSKIIFIIFLTGGILLFQFGFVFYYFCFKHGFCSLPTDIATWGQFGDFIGGTINPLLTFFTFIILLYALHEQKKELHYQYTQFAIDQLIKTIEMLINENDVYMKKYIHNEMVDFKNNNSYPVIIDIRNAIGDIYVYLKKIDYLDPQSPLIFYYKRKLIKFVECLTVKGYFTEENQSQKELILYFRNNKIT
jgi:hypothetical protein